MLSDLYAQILPKYVVAYKFKLNKIKRAEVNWYFLLFLNINRYLLDSKILCRTVMCSVDFRTFT